MTGLTGGCQACMNGHMPDERGGPPALRALAAIFNSKKIVDGALLWETIHYEICHYFI